MLIVALFLLMACASSPKPLAKPADLIQPCPALPVFKGKDLGDIVRYTVNLTKLYKVCAARHEALAKL